MPRRRALVTLNPARAAWKPEMAAGATKHDASMPGEPAEEPRAADDPGLEGKVLGGRYRILREMARGGLGCVYEALHVELERKVAIKVLSGEVARNAEAIRRFQREAQTASQKSATRTSSTCTTSGAPRTARPFSRWSGSRARTSTTCSSAS